MVEKPGGLTFERIRYVLIVWGRTRFLAGTASGCIRPSTATVSPMVAGGALISVNQTLY